MALKGEKVKGWKGV